MQPEQKSKRSPTPYIVLALFVITYCLLMYLEDTFEGWQKVVFSLLGLVLVTAFFVWAIRSSEASMQQAMRDQTVSDLRLENEKLRDDVSRLIREIKELNGGWQRMEDENRILRRAIEELTAELRAKATKS
jgi:cell division protein FtsB